MRLNPPPGSVSGASPRAWMHKRVRTTSPIRASTITLPKGSVCTVVEVTFGKGMILETDACQCCGGKLRVEKVADHQVEIVAPN
jgi:hypothetical protein